jgi:hypothetical protein
VFAFAFAFMFVLVFANGFGVEQGMDNGAGLRRREVVGRRAWRVGAAA